MKTAMVVLLLLLFLPCNSFGDDSITSVRCKNGLVNIGANNLEVIKKCGEPVHKDVIEAASKTTSRGYVEIQEWTYNYGPTDFIYTFRLEGSTVVGIRRGDRGF